MVDLKYELILPALVYSAEQGDSETIEDSLLDAQLRMHQLTPEQPIEEVAADRGAIIMPRRWPDCTISRRADVHPRTAAAARTELDRQPGGSTAAETHEGATTVALAQRAASPPPRATHCRRRDCDPRHQTTDLASEFPNTDGTN